MRRRKPTKGTVEFFAQYIDAFIAHVQTDHSAQIRPQLTDEVNKLNTAKGAFGRLEQLGQIVDIAPPLKLDVDETPMANVNHGWHRLAIEHFADGFGRYGMDAVGGIADAALYANALATAFGTHSIYYRGENRYGHALISRAERELEADDGQVAGLTGRELEELRRFQGDVTNSPDEYPAISSDTALQDLNHPRWLPVMQHYDEEFGTRLLDLTTSIFAGLYFACVAWDGSIKHEIDGVLYVFFRGNGGLIARGYYYDERPENLDSEMDDVAPTSVEDSFKDWKHPEVHRVYRSSTMSERELAQDGLFLVKGSLADGPGFGQGFKFRVPAEAKEEIARELWRAGYTPKRIVRGPKGESAHLVLAERLKMPIV